jgi:hypothetical protein
MQHFVPILLCAYPPHRPTCPHVAKQVEHMSHELDHWNKAQKQLLNTIVRTKYQPLA